MPDNTPYTALALRYRPQDFHDIIGQPTLVKTLSSAFERQKIAHAYLFTGTRGTGKTTTARILAKALNCVGADGKGEMTATPCHTCYFCKEISKKKLMDVIEIDAASHNGVDHIRELIELIDYQPQSRYRVIILDEVHMLSTPAFNALLKTLEEPPHHTKFIFATTNVEKIPLTILSRCQRFDLRNVPKTDLQNHLLSVAKQEGITLQEGAASTLVRASQGSVRDSLSLLDRAIALSSGDAITPHLVDDMLGQTDYETILRLLELLLHANVAPCLQLAGKCYQNGAAPEKILSSLLEAIHSITLYKCETRQEMTKEHPVIIELAARLDFAKLSRLWQILLTGYNEIKIAPNGMDALDMVLMRALYAAQLPAMPQNTPADASPPASSSDAPNNYEHTQMHADASPPASSSHPSNSYEHTQMHADASPPASPSHPSNSYEHTQMHADAPPPASSSHPSNSYESTQMHADAPPPASSSHPQNSYDHTQMAKIREVFPDAKTVKNS